MRPAMARGDGQQVEVVIAQHRRRGIAKFPHLAQDRERFRAAIDEVTHEPQAVGSRRERDEVQELAELGVAALNVADCVERHFCLSEGKFRRRA